MNIQLEVSEENESTSYPYWLILDPSQNMSQDIHLLAAQVTGPFFSRKEAEDTLKATRYNYSKRARVYCKSGTYTDQYRDAVDAARRFKPVYTPMREGFGGIVIVPHEKPHSLWCRLMRRLSPKGPDKA